MTRSIEGITPSDQANRISTPESRLAFTDRDGMYKRQLVVSPRQPQAKPLISEFVAAPSPVAAEAPNPVPVAMVSPIQPVTSSELVTETAESQLESQLTEKPRPTRRQRFQYASLLAVAVAVLVGTGFVGYQTWQTNVQARAAFSQPSEDATATVASTTASEGTDETPVQPDQKKAYTVSPDMPRILSISSLGIEARVLRMSLNAEGAVEAPKGIWDTGWYDGSTKPGEAGNAFIDGHVSGPTEFAIFSKLKDVTSGATISIERGDGSKLNYEVRSVETVKLDAIDMKSVLATPAGMTESLTIMTCGGGYQGNYTYDSRVIVRAERVS